MTEKIALSAFGFDMGQGGLEYFRDCYFPDNANPGKLLPALSCVPYTNGQYLENLAIFIMGASDLITFYLLGKEYTVRERYIPEEKKSKADDIFKSVKSNLKPRVLLDFVDYDEEAMNYTLFKEYGFDFHEMAGRVGLLAKVLNKVKIGEISPSERILICRGPEILEKVKKLHDVFEAFLIYAESGAADYFPDFKLRINEVMDTVILDLQTRIDNALIGSKLSLHQAMGYAA